MCTVFEQFWDSPSAAFARMWNSKAYIHNMYTRETRNRLCVCYLLDVFDTLCDLSERLLDVVVDTIQYCALRLSTRSQINQSKVQRTLKTENAGSGRVCKLTLI